mmetsp:Transcript_11664/g.27415  ORF Transcript_11664/g.27415 Transcript_11664/m.27415 type:complete len:187 (+) Transcript_11664:287-847(+)
MALLAESCEMSSEGELFTTNAHDLAEAAKLKARLEEQSAKELHPSTAAAASEQVPTVSIDPGKHKYVLVTAVTPSNERQVFVYSRRGAQYHKDVANVLVPMLESSGYSNIRITGGGRIERDEGEPLYDERFEGVEVCGSNKESRKIHIFGYSYGFGQADHALAKQAVDESGTFKGYTVTWSNDDGY